MELRLLLLPEVGLLDLALGLADPGEGRTQLRDRLTDLVAVEPRVEGDFGEKEDVSKPSLWPVDGLPGFQAAVPGRRGRPRGLPDRCSRAPFPCAGVSRRRFPGVVSLSS